MSDWADKKARKQWGQRNASDFKAKVAAALREAYERGRQEERWACHELADDERLPRRLMVAISARGPMLAPEEE